MKAVIFMLRHCAKRIISALPVLLGITLLAFLLGLITPGDPVEMALSRDGVTEVTREMVEAKRAEMGLNDPVPVQYVRWLGRAMHGDLGSSYQDGTSVSAELMRRLPATVKLAGCSLLLVVTVGILLGVISAAGQGNGTDSLIRTVTNLLMSFPAFWLGLLLIMLFAETWKLLPTSGMGTWRHMVLPSVTLAMGNIAMTIRLTRSSMLTEFGKQYMLAANAKGISKWRVLLTHALPNAIVPVITMIGGYLGGILGGSFVVENIFSIPGIGSYVLDAIHGRDYPIVQGYVVFMGVIYVLVTLMVDILCAWLQPKMRLGGRAK